MTPQLEDLVTRVGIATNRPHLHDEALTAVIDATAWYHQLGLFWRDYTEALFVIAAGPGVEHTVSLEQVPRMRTVASVAAYSMECGRVLYPLTQVKSMRPLKCDEFRAFDKSVHIESCRPQRAYRIGYYQYPDLLPASFNSWVADLYPGMVVDAALLRMYEHLKDAGAAQMYSVRVGRPGIPGTNATVFIQNQVE